MPYYFFEKIFTNPVISKKKRIFHLKVMKFQLSGNDKSFS